MLFWLAIFLAMTLAIVFAGALLGGAAFLLVGLVAGMEYSVQELLMNGLYDGGFLALIWAPGISFVACVMLANNRRKLAGQKASKA